MNGVRRFLTGDAHFIMEIFSVHKVFNLNNHVCASLEDNICIMASHHGEFGKKPNKDGLNGIHAVANLIHDIGDTMKSEGITNKAICKTKFG